MNQSGLTGKFNTNEENGASVNEQKLKLSIYIFIFVHSCTATDINHRQNYCRGASNIILLLFPSPPTPLSGMNCLIWFH